MNRKIEHPEQIMTYYAELRAQLSRLGAHFYVTPAYYYDKIAERFGITPKHAARLLNRQFRHNERVCRDC